MEKAAERGSSLISTLTKLLYEDRRELLCGWLNSALWD